MKSRKLVLALSTAAVLVTGSCAQSPRTPQSAGRDNPAALVRGADYAPRIRAGEFVRTIDNPYFPLRPGTTYRYEGLSDGEKEVNTVAVTDRTKKILGVTTTVILDRVFVAGQLTESTFDWYAQDRDGNVWYFGEDTKEYEDGKVKTTKGSWEAGVNDAKPGILMLASPRAGQAYWEEYYKGEAEDQARVKAKIGSLKVPYGSFRRVLVTDNFSPLEPKVLERKYYARGIGLIQERLVRGGDEVSRLVDVKR
jgi:hypothetical protein